MTDIDWDDIANRAQDTPRGLISEALADADGIDTIVMIKLTKDGRIDTAWGWEGGADRNRGSLEILGLIKSAEHDVLHEQMMGGA